MAAFAALHAAPRRLHLQHADGRVALALTFASDPVATVVLARRRSGSDSDVLTLIVGTRDGSVYVLDDPLSVRGPSSTRARSVAPSERVGTVPGLRAMCGVFAPDGAVVHVAVTSCLVPSVVIAARLDAPAQALGAPLVAPPALEGAVPTCIAFVASISAAGALEGAMPLNGALFGALFGAAARDGGSVVLLQGDADGAVRWLALVPGQRRHGGALRVADPFDADAPPPPPVLARIGEPVRAIFALSASTLAVVGARGRVVLIGGARGGSVGEVRLRPSPVDAVACLPTAGVARGSSARATLVHLCGGAAYATALTLDAAAGSASAAPPRRSGARPARALIALRGAGNSGAIALFLRCGRLFRWVPPHAADARSLPDAARVLPMRESLARCARTEARQLRASATNREETVRLRDVSGVLRAFTALRRDGAERTFQYTCSVEAPRSSSAHAFSLRVCLGGLPQHREQEAVFPGGTSGAGGSERGAWFIVARAHIPSNASHTAAACSACFPLRAIPACTVDGGAALLAAAGRRGGGGEGGGGGDGGGAGSSRSGAGDAANTTAWVGFATIRTGCAFVLPFQVTTWLLYVAGSSTSNGDRATQGSGGGLACAPLGTHVGMFILFTVTF